jgi:hypothetical protein
MVAQPYVCALNVAGEDLLEILPKIDQISGQVIEPRPGRVDQVNGEELDDEEVIICPAFPTRNVVILEPTIGIGFAIILDDVVWRPKMFREQV